MRIQRSIASALAAVAALLVTPAGAQAASPSTTDRAESLAPTVQWTWRWSDGGTEHRRTFSKRVYGSAANLPYLVVSNDSCASGVLIKLQFREDGRYYTEDRAYTKGCKSARLRFNPYTESGRWAIGTYKERLMIPGLAYHYFTIEYAR